jgi:hypothetical protein
VLLARMDQGAPAVATVLAVARSVAPGVEIAAEQMTDLLKKGLGQSQAGATFTAILAVLALSLSAVGIYGVVSFPSRTRRGRSAYELRWGQPRCRLWN